MNCRTSQYELSKCLDGRLASGRRAAVMEHVAGCATCAGFWDELQRAQSLVLRLPPTRVGADFRDGLFARIDSGEGTPEAVFHEPVPLAAKVRYVLTGALAAAAALLVSISLMRGDGQPVQPPGETGTQISPPGTQVAVGPRDPADDRDRNAARRLEPRGAREPDWATLAFQPAAPATLSTVATEALRRFQDSFEVANRQAQWFEVQPDQRVASTLCSQAVDLRRFGSLLLDLRQRNHLSFDDAAVGRQLEDLVVSLREASPQHEQSVSIARRCVVPALERASGLRRQPQALSVQVQVLSPVDQFRQLMQLYRERGEVLQLMFEVVPFDASPTRLQVSPIGVIQDQCGTYLLLPRRPF